MRLNQRQGIVLFAFFTQLALGCSNSSDAARNSDAGAPGAGGSDRGSAGQSAAAGAPSQGGSSNGVGGGMPERHTTGLVKLNLKVR